ncbi:MAG: PDZ domain-containing protein [Synergistes sp.]|nr:PDZ domain-containing protein [Synergistes sp.]
MVKRRLISALLVLTLTFSPVTAYGMGHGGGGHGGGGHFGGGGGHFGGGPHFSGGGGGGHFGGGSGGGHFGGGGFGGHGGSGGPSGPGGHSGAPGPHFNPGGHSGAPGPHVGPGFHPGPNVHPAPGGGIPGHVRPPFIAPGYRPEHGFKPGWHPHPGPGPRPPRPPRPYPGPGWGGWGWYDGYYGWGDGGWVVGAIGAVAILSALFNSDTQAQREAEERAYQEEAEVIRSEAYALAKAQCDNLKNTVFLAGVDNALNTLSDYWQKRGQVTSVTDGDPVSTLTVTGLNDNITLTYSLNRSDLNIMTTAEQEYYNVAETCTGHCDFTQQKQKDAAEVLDTAEKADKSIGFTVDPDKRSSDGFLVVDKVTEGTAAYYLGIRPGAKIYDIDGHSTANVSLDQLRAFVSKRAGEDASISITFSDGTGKKTGQIKL